MSDQDLEFTSHGSAVYTMPLIILESPPIAITITSRDAEFACGETVDKESEIVVNFSWLSGSGGSSQKLCLGSDLL